LRSREIKAGKQEPFFHFQFFYGLAADGLKNNLAPSPMFGTNLSATSEFGNAREDGTIEPVPLNSWSSMYWNYRYRFEGDATRGLVADEYHTVHDLLAAMKL